VAKQNHIDILLDAVLNVFTRQIPRFVLKCRSSLLAKHKLRADRTESFLAVPVDSSNRLKPIGPAREIEVSYYCHPNSCYIYMSLRPGWTAFDFSGRNRKVNYH